MPDRTAADRMARKRQRDREAGLTEILVKVPADPEVIRQIRELAASMRAQEMTTMNPKIETFFKTLSGIGDDTATNAVIHGLRQLNTEHAIYAIMQGLDEDDLAELAARLRAEHVTDKTD